MSQKQILGIIIGVAILATAATTRARAQVFSDVKTALVDYSKAHMEPRKACEAMSKFKSKEIVQITAAKMTLVADKVMAKCDAVDGLKDGLIDDPRKCAFEPARDVPACSAGMDSADCLTAPQAAAIEG